jgi:hypothetical protein
LKKKLAPYYKHNIDGFTILWFKGSNKYLVLDEKINTVIDTFLKSRNYSDFHNIINTRDTFSKDVSRVFFSEIETLLRTFNTTENTTLSEKFKNSILDFDLDKPYISISYNFNGKIIKICYQSSLELHYIHPQFAYLEIEEPITKPDCIFYIISKNDCLLLFKNHLLLGSFNSADYHLLQGKLAIELVCELTLTNESDWLATFHASTVSNDSEAVMLIGESGKGKSTLSTILMDYGYNLLTDDFTPMLAKSLNIHSYPSAISIKKKAFDLIASLSERIQYYTFQSPNSRKGLLKYVTPINEINKPLPCSTIVLVNYVQDAEASLDALGIDEALNALIPDSWISPLPEHAQAFINWLKTCHFYKLTYSNTNDAISIFESLLKLTGKN